jgi:polysaccharide biosynthesis protein PslH
MRILFIAPQVPWPANKGDRQRSHALLRALAQKHDVTLSVPATPDEAGYCLEGLKDFIAGFIPVSIDAGSRAKIPASAWRLRRLGPYAWDLLTKPSPYAFRFITDDYRARIAKHRHEFDAVFCRYMYMLPVVRDFPCDRVVVDVDDLHYLGLMRSALNLTSGWSAPMQAPEALRSYCYEQRTYRRLARVLVCSEADLSRIQSKRKSIVRNGVDLPHPTRLQIPPGPKTIIFVGQMSYGPNVEGLRWFLRRVWPSLREFVPEIRLLVVGRKADPDTLPFARSSGVDIVGEVEETASWFSSAMLSIAPLRVGLGTRIKIIESLACGRPVVSTKIGAEGLDDIDERSGLFRVDNPRRMAGCIASLLEEPDRALALGGQGRRLIESRYSWEFVTRNLASDMERWIWPPGLPTRPDQHLAPSVAARRSTP